MANRRCIVVCLVPIDPILIDDLKTNLSRVSLSTSSDLRWHAIISREWGRLDLGQDGEEASEDLGPSSMAIIAMCSISTAWADVAQKQQQVGGSPPLGSAEDQIIAAITSSMQSTQPSNGLDESDGSRLKPTEDYSSARLDVSVGAGHRFVQGERGDTMLRLCEVWLTAPCLLPVASLSLPSLTFKPNEFSQGIQLMRDLGMAVMTSVLHQDEVAELIAVTGRRIGAAEEAVSRKAPELCLGSDLFAFSEFASRGGCRFDLLLDEGDRADGGASAVAFRIARKSPWVPVISSLLGDDFGCMVSVVYSRPGAEAQEWHTDGSHFGKEAGWDHEEASPPYAICVFIPLIDLDYEVGFTQFWPGSHTRSGLLGFGSAANLLGCALDAVLPAGSCVIYDYRLMHRGMPNTSVDKQRPLLQILYHNKAYVEKKNYGTRKLFP